MVSEFENFYFFYFQKKKKPFQVIFATDGFDEAFHASFDINNKFVQRWGVFENVTEEVFGSPGDGTSIDHDEPFVIRSVFYFPLFCLALLQIWM